MKNLCIDTCIWLNILTKPKLTSLLDKIIELLDSNTIKIILPRMVKNEIVNHKDKIHKKYRESITSMLKGTRNSLKDFNDEPDVGKCLTLLSNISSSIDSLANLESVRNGKIDTIINNPNTILIDNVEDDYKKIIDMGIFNKAPFHKNVNSIADALILCAFKMFISNNGGTEISKDCVFVTDNKNDFSKIKQFNEAHEDIIEFIEYEFEYSLNIVDVINNIEPNAINNSLSEEISVDVNISSCVHSFDNGFWKPSRYGGLTWHQRCAKCGLIFDTGESYD